MLMQLEKEIGYPYTVTHEKKSTKKIRIAKEIVAGKEMAMIANKWSQWRIRFIGLANTIKI